MIAMIALAIVLAMMLGELWLSLRNERTLLARGAFAPPDPVYSSMRLAYPAVFILMAVEGALSPYAPARFLAEGTAIFVLGKAIKVWAIAALGERWTYKVLILPGAPLVADGPYRFIRHPNYVGVVGELIGMALITGARVTGPLGVLFFSWLLLRRIRAEDRALRGIY